MTSKWNVPAALVKKKENVLVIMRSSVIQTVVGIATSGKLVTFRDSATINPLQFAGRTNGRPRCLT
jgi:hypothetical protein